MRRVTALLFACLTFTAVSGLALCSMASASGTTYTPEPANVDTVAGGPWNTSQGNPSAGGAYPESLLTPAFTPGGSETTLGDVNEPNLAVYPGSGSIPYPSGVTGTPGPLSGYCSGAGSSPGTGTPVSQPPGTTLPFSPYYFPDVVRNADGSLTGYFDYRPKDADEAITVARSTDNGKTWTSEGKALEQNPGYCPAADTNDDGQGHPYVASIGGTSKLYTLNRPAGDYEGVGLLVHGVEPDAANPLASVPASEAVGIDPNTYAGSAVTVPTSGGVNIPVSTLGSEESPEHIVAGPYEDYNAATPSKSVITCTGTSAAPAELTGCTVAGESPLSVDANDDLVQVIATANPGTGLTYTVPAGPNKPNGEGGLAELKILNGNPVVSPLSTFILNENAPNRLYIDGASVYCAQSNANPTTKVENCTSANGSPLTVNQGDPITADPILPPNAQMTSGLKSPDGIIGTLPQYPGAPAGSTVVLYTQKVLADFIVGTIDGYVNESGKYIEATSKVGVPLPQSTLTYTPSVHPSEPLPSSGPFKIYLGTAVGQPIQQITCTGFTSATQTGAPSGSYNLTGCGGGTGSVLLGNWIGGPNAATVPYSSLEQIGEGTNSKSKGPEKLFGNNEDLTVLRAAYTYDGVNFSDLGAISGSTSGTGNDSGSYDDISNPLQTTSPSSSSPTNLAPGSPDTTELRFVGSRGTIITNPDGSYGMFLSGAWASDGDSDAFNQIFYTSSTDGKHWSVPKVIVSTDYSFSASATQEKQIAKGEDEQLGVSAYYSGRAYGPAVVQNPDGSLTMVFSGYRLPKPIAADGTVLGTSSPHYTISSKEPALYRNILTISLSSATTPGVPTTTEVGSSDQGKGILGADVTYTATVVPTPPGVGTPTGTVAFSDINGPIPGCGAEPLSGGSPDTATCATQHEAPAGANQLSVTYTGDANYAGSTGTADIDISEAPTITSQAQATFTRGVAASFTVAASGTPTPTVSESGTLPSGVTFDASTGALAGTPTQTGTFPITFTAHNGVGADSVQSFTLTVLGLHVTTTPPLPEATPHVPYSYRLTAQGGLARLKWKLSAGSLPRGIKLHTNGQLAGKVPSHAYPTGATFTFTVKVSDRTNTVNESATATFELAVR